MTIIAVIDQFGITAPTYADVLAALRASFLSIYGADAYIAADSQDGQFLAIFALAQSDINNAIVDVFNSFAPVYAQGAGLSSVVKINGIRRLASSKSSAPGNVVGVAGTVITGGVVKDQNGNLWDLPAVVTIPIGGSIAVTVTAQQQGTTVAPSGTIDTINSPTYGWQTFVSTSDATLGAPVETDAQLRDRQQVSTSIPAQTVLEALIGAVSNIAGVSRVRCYENNTGSTDSYGVPAHSIDFVVQGGTIADITKTIAAKKTPGTGTAGSTSAVVFDAYGVPNTIKFNILATVTMTIVVTIKALTGYVSTTGALIKAALATYINQIEIGEYSFLNRLWATANLSGDIAVAASAALNAPLPGLTQLQLDTLSSTYNILNITQSRAANPVDTTVTGGPYASPLGTVTVVAATDIYLGQMIDFVLDDASSLHARVTGVSTNDVSFLPLIPAGRNIPNNSNVYLISDTKIAFNEATLTDVAHITVTVV